MRRLLLWTVLATLSAAPLAAQGSLSLQGFGYPSGQLSTRASGTAGSIGEVDPGSPINPAAILYAGKTIFAFQIEPEYRQVKSAGISVKTATTRFPVIMVGARVGTRSFVAASFSTLLDRTWDASYKDSVRVAGENVSSTVSTSVRGAISDARVAYAWQFTEKFQAGIGVHALTGENRISLARSFTDSTTFGALSQTRVLSYAGTALSGGVSGLPLPHLFVAASFRLGGAMTSRYVDSIATRAHVPNRYGASVSYDGIPGSQIAVRYDREAWSRMRSLGSASLQVHDATDLSAGIDFGGPKVQGLASQVRLGARRRDLPFGANGNTVKETSLAVGGGVPVARGWATVDISFQRAMRKAGSVSERGNILSVGLTVRP